MRTLNPSFALASLVGFLTAASCTLITDVDRSKIPSGEAGSPATGGTGAKGGSSGTGGGGTSGKGGTGGTGTAGAGAGGESGQGAQGGSSGGGTGGSSAGSGDMGGAGMGGAPPAPEPVCKKATGTITLAPQTFIADGDTFTLSDGVNPKVVFEFDLGSPGDGVASGHVKIAYAGTEDQHGLAAIIASIINAQDPELAITAAVASDNGNGAAGASGSGGEGGSGPSPADTTAVINLANQYSGALGNVRIRDTVGNPNFQTTGMSGGEALACASDAICTTDSECASQNCGSTHLCIQ